MKLKRIAVEARRLAPSESGVGSETCNIHKCLSRTGRVGPSDPPRTLSPIERRVCVSPMICPEINGPIAYRIRLGAFGVAESAGGAKAPITSRVIACLLIVNCLWRLVAPGGPWPVTPWNYVSMGVDLLLLIGLVALWRSYPAPTPDAPPHVRWGSWLFGLEVAAGIIMLLLRFTTEHAWWTGHLRGGGF